MHHIGGTITEEQSSNHSSTHKHTESQLGWRLVTLCVCVCADDGAEEEEAEDGLCRRPGRSERCGASQRRRRKPSDLQNIKTLDTLAHRWI